MGNDNPLLTEKRQELFSPRKERKESSLEDVVTSESLRCRKRVIVAYEEGSVSV
jgi:hypothetical protein